MPRVAPDRKLVRLTVFLLLGFLAVLLAAVALTLVAKPDSSITALHRAARLGDAATVRDLVAQGVDVDAMRSYEHESAEGDIRGRETALFRAAEAGHVEVVEALLQAGADPNLRCTEGGTALTIAASRYGRADVVKLLLEYGADVSVRAGKVPLPPVLWAARGDYATFAALLQASRDELSDPGVRSVLLRQLEAWPVERSARISKKLNSEYAPGTMQYLALNNDVTGLKKALQAPDINVPNIADQDGWTPLHWSSGFEGSADAVRLLLAADANPNAATVSGYTPLMAAVTCDDIERVQILIEAGADVNAADADGCAVLHYACKYASKETVQFLLGSGADPNAKDRWGWGCMSYTKVRVRRGGDGIAHLFPTAGP